MSRVFGYYVSSTAPSAVGLIEKVYTEKFKPDGYEWGGVFTDTKVNAHLDRRSEGVKLLAMLERGDVLVLPTLAVFYSGPDAIETLKRLFVRGIRLVLPGLGMDSGTEKGLAMLEAVAGVAAFDKNRADDLRRAALEKRRLLGRSLGQAPYGVLSFGPKGKRRLVTDTHTRHCGALFLTWFRDNYSLDDIYFHCRRRKIRTRDGKEWSRSAIHRAIQSEARLQATEQALQEEAANT